MTKKIIKDTYYLDNKKIDESNVDLYLKILSDHWVIPVISKGFETKNNILWSIQYHGGWLKNMSSLVLLEDLSSITNRLVFNKNKNTWLGFLDKPDLLLLSPINKYFDLMSIGFYDEVTLEPINFDLELEPEYGTKLYVWESNNLEDILNIVFNGLTYRYNNKFKDFSHTNVYTSNADLTQFKLEAKINNNIDTENKINLQIKINNLEINIFKLEINSNQLINKEKEIETEYLKFKIEYLKLKNSILSRI
jgi:hypothetical protein